MATGIVSLAARGAGAVTLSELLLALTAIVYLALAGYHATRFARRPALVLDELRTSAIFDYLTFVAAGAVLGSGLLAAGAGRAPAWALLALSALAWLAISAAIVVELVFVRSLHPRTQAQGGWLLAVVAPQALSVLCLSLAAGRSGGGLVAVALGLWLLGSALYPPIALERLGRLRAGGRPAASLRADDWILMGALAISALAGSSLFDRFSSEGSTAGDHPLGWALLVGELALAWGLVPLLVLGEISHAATPASARGPSGSRWTTVFPLGMISVATRAFAEPSGLAALRVVADVAFAVALAAWLLDGAFSVAHRSCDLRASLSCNRRTRRR